MNNMEEDTIDLLELAKALWKNILIIALVAVLFGSAAFGCTAFLMEPEYQATASLYVNNSSFSFGSTSFSISNSDLTASNSLVAVYIYILQSRTTMEDVIKEADLTYTPEELSEMVVAKGVSSTGAFEVTVTSTNPAEAELIANTIAQILPDRISEIVDGSSVRVVDYAVIPSHRSGPGMVKNTAMGILAGGFLAAAVVVIRFLLDDKSKLMIKSADELREMYPDIPVLAMIPDMRVSEKKNGYYSSYYGQAEKKGGRKNGGKQGS
ncbi:MAG: Wzz/FepE/Etk N-terminal domain-containing protein [Oscillospiraceae bacterium]|nr:Wzz/FepE/Etk N-terminal domain-containing protein [Oscillospiraceae bacterium]